jgi:hypothetical protein
MGKTSRSGSGMNIPDHISESFEKFFGLKILKAFYVDPDPGSGIFLLRDPGWKNSDPGAEINIPDPQHCFFVCLLILCISSHGDCLWLILPRIFVSFCARIHE